MRDRPFIAVMLLGLIALIFIPVREMGCDKRPAKNAFPVIVEQIAPPPSSYLVEEKMASSQNPQTPTQPAIMSAEKVEKVETEVIVRKTEVAIQKTEKKPAKVKAKAVTKGFIYRHPNAKAFGQRDMTKMIRRFSAPTNVKEIWLRKVAENDLQVIEIRNGDQFVEMGLGNYEVVKQVTVGWLDKYDQVDRSGNLYTAEVDGKCYLLLILNTCNNPLWTENEFPCPKPSTVSVPKESEPPVAREEIPSPRSIEIPVAPPQDIETPKAPAVPAETPAQPETTVEKPKEPAKSGVRGILEAELYVGGDKEIGISRDKTINDVWGLGRFFPVQIYDGDKNINLGVNAGGVLFDGNDRNYKFEGDRRAYGLSARIIDPNWDANIDAGLAQIHNEGREGLYRAKQDGRLWFADMYFKNQKNRNKNKVWWPGYEINASGQYQYDATHEHSYNGSRLAPVKPYDDSRIDLSYTQFLYDFKFKNGFMMTPELTLGGGHEWGGDVNYLAIKAGLRLHYKRIEIGRLSFGYKDTLNGYNAMLFGAWASVGGIIEAIQASGYTAATDADTKVQPKSENQVETPALNRVMLDQQPPNI
jgi:hypothetical protein